MRVEGGAYKAVVVGPAALGGGPIHILQHRRVVACPRPWGLGFGVREFCG